MLFIVVQKRAELQCNRLHTQCEYKLLQKYVIHLDSRFYSKSCDMQHLVFSSELITICLTDIKRSLLFKWDPAMLLLLSVSLPGCLSTQKLNKKLSCRKETVRPLRESVLAKYNWKTIYCGRYRSIFNHCDVMGLQSYRLRWSNAK